MPWKSPMSLEEEREHFISDWINGSFSYRELAERYNISRKTAYKWTNRFFEGGTDALSDLPRIPKSCPHKTSEKIVKVLLEKKNLHPFWGAKKLLPQLEKVFPGTELPSRTTICNILSRHGLVQHPRRRGKPGHPGAPISPMNEPNAVWCTDFKGEYRLKTGDYCYPLTLTDGFSRYLLCCRALRSVKQKGVFPVFEEMFREFGLPHRIRMDNGAPFGTLALARLSALSVWFIRLGIYPEYIEPGCPQQNGRHERMHKTLKAEATKPPESSFPRQQRRFDVFQKEFNEERPHEGIGMATPASLYEISKRPFPKKLPDIIYPSHFIERFVSGNGGIRFHTQRILCSSVLAGLHVGMEELSHGAFNVYFGPVLLGKWFYGSNRIEGINFIKQKGKV